MRITLIRLLNTLRMHRRTRFTWNCAYRLSKPIGRWVTRADEEGMLRIVPTGQR